MPQNVDLTFQITHPNTDATCDTVLPELLALLIFPSPIIYCWISGNCTVANVTHVRTISGFGKRQFTVVRLQKGKESRTFMCKTLCYFVL